MKVLWPPWPVFSEMHEGALLPHAKTQPELEMIEPGIKSRPVYGTLKADPFAKVNLIVTNREGRAAVVRMASSVDDRFIQRTTILIDKHGLNGQDPTIELGRLRAANTWIFPTRETLLTRLAGALSTAHMGTRLYVAGDEPIIGSVVKLAIQSGISHNSVVSEHCGTLHRRVQCVHCKGYTEDVTTNPVRCAHCGLMLLVRDHYSRLIGAFQGVRIDAETPGVFPEQKAEFL